MQEIHQHAAADAHLRPLLDALLDAAPDLITIKDAFGVYLGCNPAFAALAGKPRDEICRQTDQALFGPAVADLIQANDRVVLETRAPRQMEIWITDPDGRARLLDTRTAPYFSGDGVLLGIVGVSRDITAGRRSEDALRESEASFRAFFETMDDLLVVATREGQILFANQALHRKLGYSAERLAGMNILDLHLDADRAEATGIVAAMLRGERSSCPLPLQARNGAVLPVETRIWLGKWKGADCIFGICKDLSAEQESRQRFERLFQNNPSPMALSTLPERRFVDVNDAFLRLVGYARHEIIGRTSAELNLFAHPGQQQQAATQLETAGRVTNLEIQIRCRDGTMADGLFAGEVIKNQNRQYLLTVMTDITAAKRMTTALQQERERLAWIIRGTHVGTWEWDIPSGATLFNARWAEIVGYTLEELSPTSIATWIRLTHPDDLRRSDETLQRHFRGELDYYECEARMRHKNGSWVWVLDRGQVVTRDAEGHPRLMVGTHQDITDRKVAELEVGRLSHIQHELMQLATEFVNIPTDRQDEAINQSLATMGQLIQADRAYLFAYNVPRGTMSNTHEWCAPGITAERDNLQEVPTTLVPEWVAAHQKGELVYIPRVAALPPGDNLRQILEPQGIQSLITLPLMQGAACLGFVGFDAVREARAWKQDEIALLRVLAELYAHFEARRVTERTMQSLQEHLTEARDKAQQGALAKSLFLANMSHEIRTPLNAILGYAQILGRECHACASARHAQGIIRSSEHLLELISDLLELARSDGQRLALAPAIFDFAQLLDDVQLLFARRPEAMALRLEVQRNPDVPRLLYADSGKIRQVLVNLMSNAVKFTEKGSIRLAASVLEPGTAGICLLAVDVTDTGCGIREEDQSVIFELFARLENGKRVTSGIGLGLPLCQRYASAMGGAITVESRVGEGSRFRFTFQAHAVTGDPQAPQQGMSRLAPGQGEYRILVVDDDATNREMMTALLQSVGLSVETAEDAPRALARLADPARKTIDMVFMDKRMPGMDGYEAVRRLRELPGGARFRVLIVTASGSVDQRAEALAVGADGFVAKPVNLPRLLQEVARIGEVRFCSEDRVETAPVVSFEAGVFRALPAEQRLAILKALHKGDIRTLRTLADQIAPPQAAATFRTCLEAYNYDALRTLLQAADGKEEP